MTPTVAPNTLCPPSLQWGYPSRTCSWAPISECGWQRRKGDPTLKTLVPALCHVYPITDLWGQSSVQLSPGRGVSSHLSPGRGKGVPGSRRRNYTQEDDNEALSLGGGTHWTSVKPNKMRTSLLSEKRKPKAAGAGALTHSHPWPGWDINPGPPNAGPDSITNDGAEQRTGKRNGNGGPSSSHPV